MSLARVVGCLAALVVLKVVGRIVLNYRDYFPPDFHSGFLRGRDAYFWGGYQWGFFTHVLAGPLSLVLGLILLSERSRGRFPDWHRALGRVQVFGVLLLVCPSGLAMAPYAEAGPIAGLGFAALALATGVCTALGLRAAVQRRFAEHRRWMWRSFLLLSSAVVIRVIGGAATVAGLDAVWFDPLMAWLSWVAPLAAFELWNPATRDSRSLIPHGARIVEGRMAQRPSLPASTPLEGDH